jgi:hypothetical protein
MIMEIMKWHCRNTNTFQNQDPSFILQSYSTSRAFYRNWLSCVKKNNAVEFVFIKQLFAESILITKLFSICNVESVLLWNRTEVTLNTGTIVLIAVTECDVIGLTFVKLTLMSGTVDMIVCKCC